MANIPLQSISFPGLSDKYTTPVVDNTLTQTGAAADAKKTGDEIGAIKNDLSDGTFIVNNAENAEQLTSTVGIEDTTPYLYRTSGGSVDIGDREDVKKIVGGTIANNQLSEMKTLQLEANVVSTPTIATFSGTKTHRYLVMWKQVGSLTSSVRNTMQVTDGETVTRQSSAENYHSSEGFYHWMPNVATFTDGQWFLAYWTHTASNAFSIDDIQLVDLTQDFGTAIADYVYTLESATAGAGVAWLKKHFPKQFDAGYQAYDAGTLKSIEGLSAKKTVGFNQWNEEWENGTINGQGQDTAGSAVRPKGYIPVFPNTAYYITPVMDAVFWYDADKNFISLNYTAGVKTSPNNAHYARFYTQSSYGTTYNHDICINLSDPTKDGTYEPYEAHSYPLDSDVVLRGIPKLDANNNLYYDGDEYLPDGTVNRRYGIVDLGALNWAANSGNPGQFYAALPARAATVYDGSTCRSSKYASGDAYSRASDKVICTNVGFAWIYDTSFSSATELKSSLSGAYLIYELATPTTETASPYQETQIVDDFGTEEFVLADTAFPVPVGHNTMYQNNLRAKLEMSPDSPDGDGLYVVQQESGENTYVPLASTATIQDILTRLTALENA